MSFIRTISLGNHEYQPAMGEIKMIPDIKKILYTTDLSETSNFAFSYAAGLANRYDASIVILHVLKDLSHSSEELVTKRTNKIRNVRLSFSGEKYHCESRQSGG
jgi:hypothetical protein